MTCPNCADLGADQAFVRDLNHWLGSVAQNRHSGKKYAVIGARHGITEPLPSVFEIELEDMKTKAISFVEISQFRQCFFELLPPGAGTNAAATGESAGATFKAER